MKVLLGINRKPKHPIKVKQNWYYIRVSWAHVKDVETSTKSSGL